MEKSVQKLTDCKINSFLYSKTSSNRNKLKSFQSQREVNSWDCSSPSENEKSSKEVLNDWDSCSDCQETMVEAFEFNKNLNSSDWDSDSDQVELKKETKSQQPPLFSTSGLDSFYFSNNSFSDVNKTSSSSTSAKQEEEFQKDDLLFVEDFEEQAKEEVEGLLSDLKKSPLSTPTASPHSNGQKVRSNQSEGTPDDTTIWMIPKSERTESGESNSILISSSDRKKIENLKRFRDFLKKTKSLSDMQKSKKRRRTARSSRSENLGFQKNNYNTFLLCEGSNLQRKLEIESKDSKENILSCEKFHRTRVFFTEYECKAITIDEDEPGKKSPKSNSADNITKDVTPKDHIEASEEEVNEPNQSISREENTEEPGSSGLAPVITTTSLYTVDDSLQTFQNGDFHSMGLTLKRPETTESVSESTMKADLSESWFLFDDAGQYQEISKNEVSMLFNGRSADAVLQGRAEHLVPASTLKNSKSLKNSISNFEPKESLQYILKEDDTGGDDEIKKLIDLERKVENTLFYIRPEADLKASIRIIPVNVEMIHLWKRTRDVGTSNLSLNTDLLPKDSTETAYLRLTRNSSLISRPYDELIIESENQIQPIATTAAQPTPQEFQQSQSFDFSKLLIETRVIVDTLTTNFRNLQSRLDKETSDKETLQGELSKLRLMVSHPETGSLKDFDERSLPENPEANTSRATLKPVENTDTEKESTKEEKTEEAAQSLQVRDKSTSVANVEVKENQVEAKMQEDPQSNVITVNIYTMEDAASITPFAGSNAESYSVAQSNLRIIENKMKRLQQENVCITRQNMELKRKLKEISQELEKYLSGSSEHDLGCDESKELEALREQMSSLQQELENLKTLSRDQEDTFTEENLLIREEFTKSLSSLNDWCAMAGELFEKIQTAKNKLQEIGIVIDIGPEGSVQNPKDFRNFISSYLEKTFKCLCSVKDENFLYEQALKDVQTESTEKKEISGLDQVISGYSELIEQCRKGQITGDAKNKVMEDYFAVIMEKASLMEEVKILKTENEMLLESQLEHYEKLKQTMIALKDRKSEITALESSQKLSEDEKTRMAEVLKLYEDEKKQMEAELSEKGRAVEDLIEELKKKNSEICDCNEKLKSAAGEISCFEKSCRLKDEMINKLKMENEELLNADEMKKREIEGLKEDVTNLEMQCRQLEEELTSSKFFVSESQREMTEYITHLEGLVSSSQETLEKTKQKLKETTQTVNRLKSESDILEKQHQCDLRLFNSTKDELESCKEKLLKITNKLKESEEEREKLHKKYESLACSEKQKSETLESLSREYKIVIDENDDLKEKLEIYSKDKEELLSEQRDLISKYGLLSKEIQKLQEKYRSVKTECNERTDLIKYLEMMLKENLIEYNNRIAVLEQNISQIIEKLVAYKNGMKGKHSGMDSEVKELRHQLNVTCQERKELENIIDNYYTLMKHLENEIQEREKKVDELHVKLEQQKTVECENKRSSRLEGTNTEEILKIEQLENQIAVAENELGECKRELQRCQTNHENEKKKLELTIADLRSEVKRYQLRIDVMMRNLSNSNKSTNGLIMEKRNGEDSDLQALKNEIQEKDKTIQELNDALNKYKAEVKLKEGDLENFKKKNFYQTEELKNLQNEIAKLQNANKITESQQKERDEMAEKLFQSIKLIMEERSARQTMETLALEKEKNYKNQIDQVKDELVLKVKECETLSGALEDKKKLVRKLQEDLKKMKIEVATLKGQVSNYKKRNTPEEEQPLHTTTSLTQIKTQHISQERLESCLKELKEIRNLNLELRKTEGQYQAKIVRLEDEIRDARLLIKELQGDIKTEKKSKKAFKNMILAAKMEIEKCVMGKQLMSVVAERISRHLNLSEIPSRELLSGFRLSDSSSSSKTCS